MILSQNQKTLFAENVKPRRRLSPYSGPGPTLRTGNVHAIEIDAGCLAPLSARRGCSRIFVKKQQASLVRIAARTECGNPVPVEVRARTLSNATGAMTRGGCFATTTGSLRIEAEIGLSLPFLQAQKRLTHPGVVIRSGAVNSKDN
jgi:hypothetical protein